MKRIKHSLRVPIMCMAILGLLITSLHSQAQIITTIAGPGGGGYTGDGGPATAAGMTDPDGLALDYTNGNLVVADQSGGVYRAINYFNIISRFAGGGSGPGIGDGGPATAAVVSDADFLAIDPAGTYYISDGLNNRIRKVSGGIITTIAGTGTASFSGDGGAATAATLHLPGGVVLDRDTLYIADNVNQRIRRIILSTGIINTIAGTGTYGSCGDGAPATPACFQSPQGMCMDGSRNLYIAEQFGNRIRKINLATGIISTFAGTGTASFSGDGGPATAATLNTPTDVSYSEPTNSIIIADQNNNRIRAVSLSTSSHIITTICGDGTAAHTGDGGPATAAEIVTPEHLYVGCYGTIYFAGGDNCVRRIARNRRPQFVHRPSDTITVCSNGTISLDSVLAVNDGDTGQTENWYPLTSPGHGSLAASYTGLATGGAIYPSGTSYTPTGGYTGSDVFQVSVADCAGGVDTITIHVNIIAPPSVITGTLSVCVGATTTLADGTAGGVWTSVSTGVATIGSSSGIVTGITTGTSTISYTVHSGIIGCAATATVTVNPLPLPISGPDTVCEDATITLTDSTAGGHWLIGPVSVATISPTGVVTGIGTGTAIDTYIIAATGCYVTDTVTVLFLPTVPPITGYDTACAGGTTTFADTYPGGVWASSDITIATVGSSSGIITGVAAGTATISYTATGPCHSVTITKDVHIIGTPAVPPITGAPGVCSGTNDTLSDAVAGGVWTSSDPSIATVGSSSGIVTGLGTGTVTISYTVTNMCGSTTVTRTITGDMQPYITTNATVACQSLITNKGGGVILPDTGCILVCDSTLARYYGNGDAGSTFTWVIRGGIVLADYGDSIDVMWPLVGTTGSIALYDTVGHCYGSDSACVQVIAKPHASFTASATHVCLDEPVIFTDHSTAPASSPIMYWHWNFGDGSYSSAEDPIHTFTVSGIDTVSLVVTSSCGCTDTARMVITISDLHGPVIQCSSIVCDSESTTYTASGGCGMYNWSVTGGTITSGLGTSAITVRWDNTDSSGFGYVSLTEPCTDGSTCTDTVTLRIPVIPLKPTIDGPDVICAGQEYEYSFPIWGGTQYHWGVLGDPGAIVGINYDHKLVVNFSSPGTYTIHGWYQNRIKLCGSNADKTITVMPAISITGATNACKGNASTYTLSDTTLSATWTLTDMFGATVATSTGTSFTYAFPATGTFVLSATGGFCATPLTIFVNPSPSPVDSVTGQDTVCLHRAYSYTAHADLPGTIYSWQAIGGTVTPASGSATVTATWTSMGVKQLIVTRISTSAPYCSSAPLVIPITQENINPSIKGDSLPCANAYRAYSTSYTRGEVYNWSIVPDTLGSVTSGDHTTAVQALWNNVATPTHAMVIVKVTKCDTSVSDTLNVTIQPSPGITISASANPACPQDSVIFTATSGDASYTWDFGDGTGMVTTSTNTVKHAFPANPTLGNDAYIVKVRGIPGLSANCPPAGTAVMTEYILPGPVAYASTASTIICVGDSTLITGTVTSNVTGLTYQWYDVSSGAIAGATGSTYEATAADSFYFTVTASNGCATTSNKLPITTAPCGPPPPCDTVRVTATTSDLCDAITLTGGPGGTSPHWTAAVTPVGGPLPAGRTATAAYDVPGIYTFFFTATFPDTCNGGLHSIQKHDTVGVVPNFRYELKCAAAGTDSIFLSDYSAYLPFWTIDTVRWYDASSTLLGTGANIAIAHTAPASYPVTEVIKGTRPGGTYSCSTTISIPLPGLPHASFTDTLSPICQGVPIRFTATSTAGMIGYSWDFGDHSSVLLQNPQRTFTDEPIISPGASETFTVTLTVTDSIGCTADTTGIVQIYKPNLSGNFGPARTINICSPDAPVILTYVPDPLTTTPTGYVWSTGATAASSISVSQSGAYWVTVFDAHQCQATVPAPTEHVNVILTPHSAISGRQNYCSGDVVRLVDNVSSGVSYQWYRDGSPIATTSSILDAGVAAGDHYYQVIIGVTDTLSSVVCYDTSAADTVHMNPLPPPPTITGITPVDCSSYTILLTATEPTTGSYAWSDGHYGALDYTNHGGAYRVWFTDGNGCVNYSDTTVPMAPDTYFPYLPSGCYSICSQMLPLTLYGPPGASFSYWAWLAGSDTASSGTGAMSSYTIDSAGSYGWVLANLLCSQTSDPMSVTVEDCSNCQKVSLNAVLTCDTATPAGYDITVSFNSPGAGTAYTLGTDIGPIDPFSGVLTGGGTTSLTLSFTTLRPSPLPDSVTVQLILTPPTGGRCYQKITLPLPPCTWIAERPAHSGDSTKANNSDGLQTAVNNAMLVYPNPATNEATVSYDYGTSFGNDRRIVVYDATGRLIAFTTPQSVHGNWNINISDWTPGIYIVRMEADGKPLQTQRIVIVSK